MTSSVEVVIVGAGPYGLSLAAYLQKFGVSHRIFGPPMHSWIEQMPKGMMLKSAGFASTLYDPSSAFTLERFCREHGIAYADAGWLVKLDTFAAYGLEFQRRMVPHLEPEMVTAVDKSPNGFRITLNSGEVISARKVVLAVGITHFSYIPPELDGLSRALVTHASDHNFLDRFRGREVAVIGAGASAVDLAALLHETGASVQLLARKPTIDFPTDRLETRKRPFLKRLVKPVTGIGVGWKSVLCAEGPTLFHRMPADFRHAVVRRHLGPAPGPFLRERVIGKVKIHLGCTLKSARTSGSRVNITMAGPDGAFDLSAEHVICGTGYRVNINRLRFLSPELREQIAVEYSSPILSPHFESSIDGLYFVGLAAAASFGPLLRFVYGAGFTSKRLSRYLLRTATHPRAVAGVGALAARQ